MLNQIAEDDHTAFDLMNEKKNRLGTAGSNRNQGMKLRRFSFAVIHQRAELLDRRSRKQSCEFQIDPVFLLHLREQTDSSERLPAELEEVVPHTHLVDAQQLLPPTGQSDRHVIVGIRR